MTTRIYLSPPHLNGSELELVTKAFASNWIAPVGPDIDAFEEEVCAFTGSSHAVALSSGTAALHLALVLCGIGEGDEVLCSTFTFAGSAFPIRYLGATPVFVDSEERSWNMDPALLEQAIKDRMRYGRKPGACIVVHLYGQAADLDAIIAVCNRYEVPVIEDAAESLGGLYKGRHTGTIASLGVFSFNGNKIITSSGGGMLVGDDKEMMARARYLATQAREPLAHYEHTAVGFNYRMSNIVAAIGRGQLRSIEERVGQKRRLFSSYVEKLAGIDGIVFMPEPDYGRANRWLTCITIDPTKIETSPEDIRLALEQENIESRPLWKPMHMQPVFSQCPACVNGVSERLFREGLCLPSGTSMSHDDLERIIVCVEKVLGV